MPALMVSLSDIQAPREHMIFHHLTLAVFVLPPDLRWSRDVFQKLVQSLGDQVKTFSGDWAIIFKRLSLIHI